MTNAQLWAENELLRQRLHEAQQKLEEEHELRLKFQAENLWMKRLLSQKIERSQQERSQQDRPQQDRPQERHTHLAV